MNTLSKPERETQNRVIRLLVDTLGYTNLGDWSERAGNSNIEEGYIPWGISYNSKDGLIDILYVGF